MARWLHDDPSLYISDDDEYHFEEPHHYQDKYLYDIVQIVRTIIMEVREEEDS
jgi:hypothetical protein